MVKCSKGHTVYDLQSFYQCKIIEQEITMFAAKNKLIGFAQAVDLCSRVSVCFSIIAPANKIRLSGVAYFRVSRNPEISD